MKTKRIIFSEAKEDTQEYEPSQEEQDAFGPAIMTIQEFQDDVNSGCLTDYDGIGYFGDEFSISKVALSPSTLEIIKNFGNFTHVHWFNK